MPEGFSGEVAVLAGIHAMRVSKSNQQDTASFSIDVGEESLPSRRFQVEDAKPSAAEEGGSVSMLPGLVGR